MKYKVIIDTDPGIDDMVALTIALAKSDVFDIKLISTVFGNVNVEQNTKNTLFLLNAMKRKDIKLVKGAKASIANKSINAENVHGKNGLGGFKIKQKINISNIRTDPIEAMKNVIENNKNKIILISLGPKTNIANLFTKYPHVINLIKTHICMGGSLFGRGNITPLSEFNVYADPLAFKIVTEQKKLKTIISPMEIGEQLIFSQEIANEIKKINSIGNFFSQMWLGYKNKSNQITIQNHDVALIIYLLNKKIFKTSGYDIETSKNGQTIMKKDKNSNTKVIVSASALRYINFFKKIISGIKTKISI